MRKTTFLATLTTVSVGVSALLVLPATAAPGLAPWSVQDAGTVVPPTKPAEKIATAVTNLSVAAGSAGTQERVLVTGRLVESATSLFPLTRMPVTIHVTPGTHTNTGVSSGVSTDVGTGAGATSKCHTSTDTKGTFRCTLSSRRNGAGLMVTATFSGNQLFAASTASITMDGEAVPAATPAETNASTPAPETEPLVPGAIVPLPADSSASPQAVPPATPAPERPVASPSATPNTTTRPTRPRPTAHQPAATPTPTTTSSPAPTTTSSPAPTTTARPAPVASSRPARPAPAAATPIGPPASSHPSPPPVSDN